MSFLGGAECSTAGNPLSQFTKHVQDDKSLQRDRLVGIGPGRLQEGFRSQQNGTGQDQMMQDFMQQNGQITQDMLGPFEMEQMRRNLDGYRTTSPRIHSPNWAAEFDPGEQVRMEAAFRAPKAEGFIPAGFTPQEFERFQHLEGTNIAGHKPSFSGMNGYQRPMGFGSNMGFMGSQYRPMGMHRAPSEQVTNGKGKARMTELDDKDWEQQFAEIDAAGQQDLDAEANAAIERELDDMDRSVLSETNEFGDFESVWRGIQAETAASMSIKADGQYGMHVGEEVPLRDFDTWGNFDSQFQDSFRDPQLGNYLFEEDNPFTATGKNPFDEGMQIIRSGGNLSLAALAFEAACQKSPSHVEAWTALGSAQAQNEKESPAIRALEQALKLDPTNLSALMGLAISYTNEGYESTAYRTLERWLATKYPQIIDPADIASPSEFGFTDRHILHENVTALFIRAAQLSPSGEQMDPDVQVGLGVLFYGAEEYSKAVDCFEAALASTESGITNEPHQAHLLWNRLGATLANSGRSEEAIAAYERALTLNPNFVRARYNLGVSCINLGVYTEAAQHLLGALSMHRVVEREGMARVKEVMGEAPGGAGGIDEKEVERMVGMNQSTNLLETLRRVFTTMGRRDLAERVVSGMDVEAFRDEFDF
ncbi:Peroxisomal membrane signal receptor PTS1 [Puttea exsequens]|nr:Peroxisomal membrane signal receptor PTS1 [Puttea exsequens]